MKRFYFVVRVDPASRDYGQRDVLVCHPDDLHFLLRELAAFVVGEGRTREEATVGNGVSSTL